MDLMKSPTNRDTIVYIKPKKEKSHLHISTQVIRRVCKRLLV